MSLDVMPQTAVTPTEFEVETEEPGIFERWQEVADFYSSTSTDPHFTCDSVTGLIRFGPAVRLPSNRERQHGSIPLIGSTIRFTQYRIGGGVVGHVGNSCVMCGVACSEPC